MYFDDILEVPYPLIAPEMKRVDTAEQIRGVWTHFMTPLQEAHAAAQANYEELLEVHRLKHNEWVEAHEKWRAENPDTSLDHADEPVEPRFTGARPPQVPLEVRTLQAILRAFQAGLNPEDSGWKPLREAAEKAAAEITLESAGAGEQGQLSDKIAALVPDIHEVGDAYIEGVKEAWDIVVAWEKAGTRKDGE